MFKIYDNGESRLIKRIAEHHIFGSPNKLETNNIKLFNFSKTEMHVYIKKPQDDISNILKSDNWENPESKIKTNEDVPDIKNLSPSIPFTRIYPMVIGTIDANLVKPEDKLVIKNKNYTIEIDPADIRKLTFVLDFGYENLNSYHTLYTHNLWIKKQKYQSDKIVVLSENEYEIQRDNSRQLYELIFIYSLFFIFLFILIILFAIFVKLRLNANTKQSSS